MHTLSTKISSLVQSYSIATLHLARMDYPRHKSSLASPSRTHFPGNGSRVIDTEKIASESQQRVELYYNLHACTLPEIHIGSNVAIQNRDTKRWDIYGKVTHIDLHHQYYIKTSSGRVLVRNRRFIRRRAPLSIPTVHQPMQRLAASNERATNTPQHPNCQRRRPGRLIEDMKSFSLCVK